MSARQWHGAWSEPGGSRHALLFPDPPTERDLVLRLEPDGTSRTRGQAVQHIPDPCGVSQTALQYVRCTPLLVV
jgi:hypothetical protein